MSSLITRTLTKVNHAEYYPNMKPLVHNNNKNSNNNNNDDDDDDDDDDGGNYL